MQRKVEIYGDHGCFAYHYTTADAAFAHILPTTKLRLSRLAEMRDPVENKDWVQVLFPPPSWSTEEMLRFEAVARQVIYETKILSFTVDSPEAGRRPEHSRGYARPRMWEQYAENHRGVCLVFDLTSLRARIEGEVARFRRALFGLVTYSDLPLEHHETARSLDATDLVVAGRGDYERGLEIHLDEHAQELFFRKLSDWSTESEYRFIVTDGTSGDIVLDFGDTLRAVVLGEHFPAWQIPAAAELCRANGIDLKQIRWGAFPPGVFDPCAPPI
jgi:hypothetical protein